jgi:Flp pilus assembly protein TadD
MPVGHAAWHAPSVWQAVAAAQRNTLTVGWPATWPATVWPGTHVDENFALPTGPDFDHWAMPLDCVAPDGLRERLRSLRLHPADVTGLMLAPLVPRLTEVDQYRDARLTELAVMLSTTTTLHAAATGLIETEAWDLACIHYPLLEDIQRRFSRFDGHPIWRSVVDAAYTFVDAMLGRLLDLVDADTSVWLVSPSGVRSVGGVPAPSRTGLFAARGRWIDAGAALPPMRLVDVVPSVLARFGLTMETDGTVIRPLAPGRSQRPVSPPAGTAAIGAAAPFDRDVAALRAAGYRDEPTAAQISATTAAHGRWLRGRGEGLIERGRIGEAEAALRQAHEKLPDDPLVLRRLAMCAVLRSDAAACRELGRQLVALLPQVAWGCVAVAAGYALDGDAASAWPEMAKAEERGGEDAELLVRLGGVALMLREDGSAARYFSRALELEPGLDGAVQGLAMAGRLAEANGAG